MLCFRKYLVAKKFMDKKRGGISHFSVEKFFFHSSEKFRSGTLKSFIHFGYRINLRFRGLCHDFPSKFFFLTVRNIS